MLVKTIIVFTSIYFESCYKIAAWSNKSILLFFFTANFIYMLKVFKTKQADLTKWRSGFI